MNIEILLVANGASVENGLLSVSGGGWEYFSPPFFPSTIRGVICGMVTLDEGELGTTPVLSFHIEDHRGRRLDWKASTTIDGVRPPTTSGVLIRVPFVVPMSVVVSAPTVATIAVSRDDVTLETTSFEVRDSVPNSPAG